MPSGNSFAYWCSTFDSATESSPRNSYVKKFRIIKSAPAKVADFLNSQARTANQFTIDCILDTTPQQHTQYLDRHDCKWLPTNVDISLYHCYTETLQSTQPLFERLFKTYNSGYLIQPFEQQLREWFGQTSTVDKPAIDMAGKLRNENSDCVFIPIDKDIKRRVMMTKTAYWYRLGHMYFTDPQHYKVMGKPTSSH